MKERPFSIYASSDSRLRRPGAAKSRLDQRSGSLWRLDTDHACTHACVYVCAVCAYTYTQTCVHVRDLCQAHRLPWSGPVWIWAALCLMSAITWDPKWEWPFFSFLYPLCAASPNISPSYSREPAPPALLILFLVIVMQLSQSQNDGCLIDHRLQWQATNRLQAAAWCHPSPWANPCLSWASQQGCRPSLHCLL